MKRLALCLLLTSGARSALAIDSSAGTGGASFMRMGLGSARALALGQAFVALADGVDALTWNPAGLATAQQREVAYSYYRYVQKIDSPFYMGYAHPLGRTVFGANMAYLSMGDFDVRDEYGRPGDNSSVKVQDGFGTLSMARSFWYEKLFLGASARLIMESYSLPSGASAHHDAVVGDVGAIIRPNSFLSLGWSAQNLGAGKAKVAPVSRYGAALRLFELLQVSGEASKASDGPLRAGLGAEFILPEDLLQVGQISLRAGYRNADDLGQVLEGDRSFLYPLVGSPRWSFGLGIYTAQAFGFGISFDYTLMSLGALGTADQMAMKVRF